jgi:hypothetical protein
MRPKHMRLSFAEGTEAYEERGEIAEKLEPVSGVKEPYAVATKIVKERHTKAATPASVKKTSKKVGGRAHKGKGKRLKW